MVELKRFKCSSCRNDFSATPVVIETKLCVKCEQIKKLKNVILESAHERFFGLGSSDLFVNVTLVMRAIGEVFNIAPPMERPIKKL